MKPSHACAALFAALCTATALSAQFPATVVTTNKVGDLDVEYRWNYTVDTETQTASFDSVTPHPFGAITLADVVSDGTRIYAVKKIAPLALADARALTSVTIPSTFEEIGACAFSNCTSLADVSIPEGVRYIGARAFVNTAITQIALPDTLLDMGGNVAAGTLYTTTISIGDSSHFAFSEDGVLYNRDMTKLYACPTRAEGTITIPDTTTNICQDAFFGCFRLVYLNLPENVGVIGPSAFNVSGIWPGLSASESTPKLNAVFYNGDRPDAADDIYDGAPTDLTSYAFTDDWSGLVSWKGRAVRPIDNTNPPVLAYKDPTGITWHYRIVDGSAEIYNEDADGRPVAAISPISTTGASYAQKDENGNTIYASALRIPASINGYAVTRIGAQAFSDCRAIPYIGIPSSVLSIGARAFAGCAAAKAISAADSVPFNVQDGTIAIPNGVTHIGYHAFEGITAASVALPYTITSLDGNPVAGCAFVGTLAIDAACPRYYSANNLVYDKKMSTLVAVPANYDGITVAPLATVTTIGPEALFGCENLESVSLPDGLKTISASAFAGCSGLVNLALPASVATIGPKAFENCTALQRATFAGDAPSAADDIYAGASAVSTYARESTEGWPADSWKGRPLVVIKTDEMTGGDTFSVTENGITWYFRGADGVAEIYRAGQTAVSSEDPILSLTLPTTLGSYIVKGLGTRALAGLRGITSVAIPDTYEWIGDFAFADCTSLSSVGLGAGLRSLGKAPFRGTNIQTLEIPATLTALDGNPLAGASQTTGVTVAENNPAFSAVDGILYDKRLRTLLACPATKTEIDLPDTVTALAADALDGCDLLDELRVTVDAVTWRFMCDGQGVTICGANGANGVIEIPAALCALPVTDVADDAFNDCTGVTAFRSRAAAVVARGGCLYSADGRELIRVPDTYVFPYDVVTTTTTASTSATTIPAVSNDGTDATRTTVTTNATETTTARKRVAGNAAFENVLAGVTKIRDYAFYGCNAFTNTLEAVTNSTAGATGLLTSADGTKVPYVKSVTSVVVTETVYETACPLAAAVDVAPNAFAESAITAAETSAAEPAVDAPAPALAENTSYLGWTMATDRTTGARVMTGVLTAKTGRLRKGALKVTGSYTPLGGKKQRLSSSEQLLALPGLVLAKDLSKSRVAAEKASFDRLRGKLWTIALDARATDDTPLHGGFSGLSLAVGQKGKVKVSGFLADGTSVGVTAQAVTSGDGYVIPVLAQLYAGRRGGFTALVRIDAEGNLAGCTTSPLTAKVNGGFRTFAFDCVDMGTAGEIRGGAPVIDSALDDAGYSIDSAATGWPVRYTARTGLFRGTVKLRDAGARRVRATFYAVSVNGIGYGATLVKKVASWRALVVAP